jgi:septum formation protein
MEEALNNQANQPRSQDLSASESASATTTAQLPILLLASSSPRRSEILRMIGWPFQVGAVEVDESLHGDETPRAYVERLAAAKANSAAEIHSHRPVVAADTTVVIDEHLLAKPNDTEDAKRMLRMLHGRWHQVLTGIALICSSETRIDCETTEVKFAAMTEAEIDWYVSTGEPMDKAGAYAVQGRGARFIEAIKGDYFNVMGLPVRLLYELIRR